MWRQRTVIPSSLGQPILSELHDCTHEVNSVQSIWQPGIDQNIERLARECQPCQNTREFLSENIIKTKDNPMCFLSPKVLTLFISNYLSDLHDFPNFLKSQKYSYNEALTKRGQVRQTLKLFTRRFSLEWRMQPVLFLLALLLPFFF